MKTATENLEAIKQHYGDVMFLEIYGNSPIPKTFDVIESTDNEICITIEMPVYDKGLQPFVTWRRRDLYIINDN